MAVYEFELPDGTIVEAEGPDGLSQEEAMQMGMQDPQVQKALGINQGIFPDSIRGDVQQDPNLIGGGPMTDEQKIGLAQIGGSGIGAMMGLPGGPAGMVVGGGAGAAIGDLLARKYYNDDEITPSSAAESFAVGLASEAIPGVGLALAKPAGKLAWKTMRRALDMSNSKLSQKYQDKIIQTALDEGLAINARSMDEVGARVKSLSEAVDKRAAELTAQGETIQIDQIMKITKDHIRTKMGTWNGNDLIPGDLPAYNARAKFVDKNIEPNLKASVWPEQTVTPNQSLELKRAIDAQMHKQHMAGVRPDASPGSSIANDAKMGHANAQRTVLNRDPQIAELNAQQHPLLAWQEQAGNTALARRPGFADNVLNAAILEAAYRGAPGGVASSLGMARYLSSMPGLKSHVANRLNKFSKGVGVPTGAEILMYKETMKNLGGWNEER